MTIITDNPRLAEGLDPNPIVIPNNVRRGCGGVGNRYLARLWPLPHLIQTAR